MSAASTLVPVQLGVTLPCTFCVPELAGHFTTICETHLRAINAQPIVPITSCDVCEPKLDDRLASICPEHLRQLAGTLPIRGLR